MALEAVVYPPDPFGYGGKDLFTLLGGGTNWVYDDFNLGKQEEDHGTIGFLENQTETNYAYADWNSSSSSSMLPHLNELHLSNPNLSETTTTASDPTPSEPINLDSSTSIVARPKRRRARNRKNKEEIENQRMTHIAVERNRRKQMNEYLSVLRSLMPDSYVQRGDQASIIGGAINFVKELEQRLQLLGAQKETAEGKSNGSATMPFSEFFTFPQYSTNSVAVGEQVSAEAQSDTADIEVTMVESHANLKIRSKKRPKQLLKMVSCLHTMRLTILHLNITTTADIVLYSLSVKVEDDCKLNSVDEIATAVYHMLGRIQQEAMLN
ncbi:hypothetical protein L6164_010535 [Bauhinia variegata]|uniref:Uncharacterized protein n=1 Tax=Bauhinia variegata TaxID=167791 RepID=A0ACB9PNA5_BAUVA|nr:hypothetical protein L6164_010535 [Bauhinia variegata]